MANSQFKSYPNGIGHLRPRLPAKMQATKSLVLKAVADAQKSVASSRPKVVVEPKEEETEHKQPVALFTRRFRDKTVEKDNRLMETLPNPVEAPMELDSITCEQSVEKVEDEADDHYPLAYSPEPESEPVETRFIVTLDGCHLNVEDKLDADFEEEEFVSDEDFVQTSKTNVKSRLDRSYRRRSTGRDFLH